MLCDFDVALNAHVAVVDVLSLQTNRISKIGVLRWRLHTENSRLQWVIWILVEVLVTASLRLGIVIFDRI